jgi:hypothetical protein
LIPIGEVAWEERALRRCTVVGQVTVSLSVQKIEPSYSPRIGVYAAQEKVSFAVSIPVFSFGREIEADRNCIS